MGFLGDRDREVLERMGFQDGKRGSGVLRYLSRRLRGEIGAGSDPELALWMARGCCALGDYEHYHMAVRWLERAGRAAGSSGEALGLLALGKMYCGHPEEALACAWTEAVRRSGIFWLSFAVFPAIESWPWRRFPEDGR